MVTAMPYRLWIAIAGFGLMALGALVAWLGTDGPVKSAGSGLFFIGVVLAALVVPD